MGKRARESVEQFLDHDTEVQGLRRRVGQLERQLKKAQAKESSLIDAVVEALIENPPALVAPKPPRIRATKGHPEEIAVLHLSDVQLGKVTESYDTAKAEERVMLACSKAIEIAEVRRTAANIEELRLYLGGDMIEGEDVFATQAHEIDSSVYDQACVNGPGIFARGILALLEAFPRVKVCTVAGNHGRNGPPHARAHPRTNWDQVLYSVTRTLLLGTDAHPRSELAHRLTFIVSERFWHVDRVYRWGNLLVHGHQIRGGFAGFPWYGAAKKIWGWIDAIGEPFDQVFLGHFHTPASATLNNRRFYANGTTESDNAYAKEELAASGDPCQRLVFMNDRHGVISDHPLYLTDRRPNR